MPVYPSISPVDDIYVGAYGALKAACAAIGGAEKVTIKPKHSVNYTTAAKARGAKTGGRATNPEVVIEVTGIDNIAAANLALALGATQNGAELRWGKSMTGPLTEHVLYIEGQFLDGVSHGLKVYKAVLPVDGSLVLGDEAQKVDMTFEALADLTQADEEWFMTTYPLAADTTPPTVASVSPADAATGVAKAASTVLDWVFSEAILASDVNAQHFFVSDDANNVVAGTVAVITTDGKTVRFTPSGAYSPTTQYHRNVVGVHDLAGNVIAAPHVSTFTTGA